MARLGWAWRGQAGGVRRVAARWGKAGQGKAGKAGAARLGEARRGGAGF